MLVCVARCRNRKLVCVGVARCRNTKHVVYTSASLSACLDLCASLSPRVL